MNNKPVCTACGTQYAEDFNKNNNCPICEDERQYVPEKGQGWSNLNELTANFGLTIRQLNDNLYELKMVPSFGIGQRAFLLLSPNGNVLWDCITLLNESAIAFIRAKGGLKAIAFSHPHYYSTMNDWASVFNCEIYIHAKDEQWVYYKTNHLKLWEGEQHMLWDGLTLHNIGGHFPGSSILHIPAFTPKGTILCGDTFYISPNKKHFSFMYSYPNRIPLPITEVKRIRERMHRIDFDTIHGFYDYQNIYTDAKKILETSFNKYI